MDATYSFNYFTPCLIPCALSSILSVRPSIILRGIKLTPKPPQYATRDHCNESGSQVLALDVEESTGNATKKETTLFLLLRNGLFDISI